MRFAICDDNRRDTETLRDILMHMSASSVIECFGTGEEFLAAARERRFDLVFMDIYLQKENGIEVIRALRKLAPETDVVFTTVSDAHAVDAFSVRAIHYLVKPFTEADVAEALERSARSKAAEPPGSVLSVRIGNDIYTLEQREIVRVEASDHKTNIFMKNGSVYSIWMQFNRVAPQLDDSFLPIKRGVAVNMRHIVKWRAYDCETSDGMSYLLNRGKRQQLKETYFAYKMNELSGKR